MRYYLIVLVVMTVNACSPRLISAPPSTQITLPTDQASIAATPDSQRDKMTSLAIADLATRLSLDRKQVRVLSVEAAMWPDAALGCPHPGEVLAEQAEPGYLIVLEANGESYEYRTDMKITMILCDSMNEEDNPTKGMDQNIDDGWPNETKDKDVIFLTPVKKP
jgi:hypothetical protein